MSDHLPPELEALLVDALTGELDAAGRARLDEAIAADPTIADLLVEQASVAEALGADVDGLTELESARLRRGVGEAVAPTATERTDPVARPWVRWAFSAAAVLVLVVGGIGFLTQGGGDDAFVESAESALEPTADDAADDSSFDAGTDAAERGEESTGMADGDLAATEGDGEAAESADEAMVPRAAALACDGETITLADPLVFETVDDAVVALGDEARGTFDPRQLEGVAAPDGDDVVVTWFDDGAGAYQARLAAGPDGWSVVELVVCVP